MSVKLLTSQDNESLQGATGSTPGIADFPLGSNESRAAARALLQTRGRATLSKYDEDALHLYHLSYLLDFWTQPSCEDLHQTPEYIRGEQLYAQRHGEELPAYLDGEQQRFTLASGYFKEIFGREPKEGDILRHSHVALVSGPAAQEQLVGFFIAAWNRRITGLTWPHQTGRGTALQTNDNRQWNRMD
jgi:hypothetical protein